MLLVGLTGGIGSGKSTVAAGLAERSAAVIDADEIARHVVEPGGRAYQALIDRFGAEVLQDDGTLDRPALAGVVFSDPSARADLDSITHPAIGQVMAEQVGALGDAPIVVLDVPLLKVGTVRSYGLGAVIVVDAPTEVAVERLVGCRGFTEADARARIAAQMSRQERRALVDLVPAGLVVDNAGDRRALEAEIDRTWAFLSSLMRKYS
ncbi:MAG: dephospho-CoA kinase [Actinomycetota bacterium]|nr:dephospho-CoA kinase [Actinomycetota bacterium]